MKNKTYTAGICLSLLVSIVLLGQACEIKKLGGSYGELSSNSEIPGGTPPNPEELPLEIISLNSERLYRSGGFVDLEINSFQINSHRIRIGGSLCSALFALNAQGSDSQNKYRCYLGANEGVNSKVEIINDNDDILFSHGNDILWRDYLEINFMAGLLNNTSLQPPLPAEGIKGDARYSNISGLAVDEKGQFAYISDSQAHLIHQLNLLTGESKVFLGSLSEINSYNPGYQDGVAAEAEFSSPSELALRDGKLYIADEGNAAIRVYDFESNEVSTFLGTPNDRQVIDSANRSEVRIADLSSLYILGNQLFFADLNCLRVYNFASDETQTLVGQVGQNFDPGMTSWTATDNSTVTEYVLPQVIESPNPYAAFSDIDYVVTLPEKALRVSLEFEYVDVENGFDFVRILGKKGIELDRLTGNSGGTLITDFYPVNDTKLIVNLLSDVSVQATGFRLVKVHYIKESDFDRPLSHSLDATFDNALIGRIESISSDGQNLFIGDSLGNFIREINFQEAQVKTLFGNGFNSTATVLRADLPDNSQLGINSGTALNGLFVDGKSIYFSDASADRVLKLSRSHGQAEELIFTKSEEGMAPGETDGGLGEEIQVLRPGQLHFHPQLGLLLANPWNVRVIE